MFQNIINIIKELENIQDNYNLFFHTSLYFFLILGLTYLIFNLFKNFKSNSFIIYIILIYMTLLNINSYDLIIQDKKDNLKNEVKLLKILLKEKRIYPKIEQNFYKDFNMLYIDYISNNKYLTSNDILKIKNKILKFNLNILRSNCLKSNKILNYKNFKCMKSNFQKEKLQKKLVSIN